MQDPQWIEIQRAAFGLRMDAAGRFWRDGEVFEHPRIVAFLRRHIEQEAGGYVVRLGQQWVPLELADLPVRVRSLAASGNELRLDLDDGRKGVLADPQKLRCDAQERVSCQVPSVSGSSTLDARLSNHALMQVSEYLCDLDGDAPRWVVGDCSSPGTLLPRFFERPASG